MKKTEVLATLNKYLYDIAESNQFDDSFSEAIKAYYKSIVFNAFRLAKRTKEDPEDVIQHLVIELWLSMKDFYKTHFVVDGTGYTLQRETEDGYYLRNNKEVYFFEKDKVQPTNANLYQACFHKRRVQISSGFLKHRTCESRGSKFDHVFLQDTCQSEEGDFTIEDLLECNTESPETACSFEELKQLIWEDLSPFARIYFDAVGTLKPGPIEGWTRPLKLYKRELLHARAELYRTYFQKIKGYNFSARTDELLEGVKDPCGLNERKPVHVGAGVLKR